MHNRLLTLLVCLLTGLGLPAADRELINLEADMLKFFSTNDMDTFFKVTDRLKEASLQKGEMRLYYKAWANQALYEATQQDYAKAFYMSDEIMRYALERNDAYGEYAALHARATILLQKQDYAEAEKAFITAVDFHHKHFPGESAGEDLQELMKIANHRKDGKAAVKYAQALVDEPGVAPIHKGRGLYQLSQSAFNRNDTEAFNKLYEELMHLKRTEGISALKPVVEVNYHILNGQYDRALALADSLDPEVSAERKAVIYHRMGDDARAYQMMQLYKNISDSIVRVSHGNVVASCYVQMNNDRLQMRQQLLEIANGKLRFRWYLSMGLGLVAALLVLLYRRHKTIKLLQGNNRRLSFESKDAAKALEDLAELSYYDMKAELPLTTAVKLNRLCKSLTGIEQDRCQRGVSMVFRTDLDDDFEIHTNYEALKKMLEHLLDNAARFNHQGSITLACEDKGEFVRFSLSDTTPSADEKYKNRFIGMFTEQDNKLRYVGMTFKICQSITRLLKGAIRFDTGYAKGTRLFIDIPKEPK